MCGIVGAAGNLDWKDKDALRMLMHFAELRGDDSTGFFAVSKSDNEPTTFKVAGPTRDLFDSVAWDKLQTSSKRVFSGHCRKATIGPIKRSTAHPFSFGRITGVHNGTLKNWRYLPGESQETDSATLFENFNRVGVRPTLEATDGAYALVWWEEDTETLNIVRNNERPLFYAFDDRFDKLFWASEEWMLRIALGKAGIKLANLTPKDEHERYVLPVEVDTWWRIKPGRTAAKDALTFLNAEAGHDETMKGGVNPAKYEPAPFRPGSPVTSPFPLQQPGQTHGNAVRTNVEVPARRLASPAVTGTAAASTPTKPSPADTSRTESTSQPKDSQASRPTLSLVPPSKSAGSAQSTDGSLNDGYIVGFNGLILTREEYRFCVDPECIWCHRALTFDELLDDPNLIGEWTDDDSYVCADCDASTTIYYTKGA